MEKIIAANDPIINSTSSESILTTANSFSVLPKLEYNLLNVAYEDYQAMGCQERTSVELGKRFNKHPVTIRKAWQSLKERKLIDSKEQGGGRPAKMWITFEGFSWLDNQTLQQTLQQNHPILYIDLSEEELINTKILEEPQNCGQSEEIDPQAKLEKFLQKEKVSHNDRDRIRNAFYRYKIGPVRSERVINRVIAKNKKSFIGDKRKYLEACLHNEMKELKSLASIFKNKPIEINYYC